MRDALALRRLVDERIVGGRAALRWRRCNQIVVLCLIADGMAALAGAEGWFNRGLIVSPAGIGKVVSRKRRARRAKRLIGPRPSRIDHIGVDIKVVNRIVKERTGISPIVSVKLAYAFGTSPEFWLNAQMAVDIFQAEG